jgi:hypothetical protein
MGKLPALRFLLAIPAIGLRALRVPVAAVETSVAL